MPRLFVEHLPCPHCATPLTLRWWDDIKTRIFRIKCRKCQRAWDYVVTCVGGGSFTVGYIQN